jgi:hypothetical protein
MKAERKEVYVPIYFYSFGSWTDLDQNVFLGLGKAKETVDRCLAEINTERERQGLPGRALNILIKPEIILDVL